MVFFPARYWWMTNDGSVSALMIVIMHQSQENPADGSMKDWYPLVLKHGWEVWMGTSTFVYKDIFPFEPPIWVKQFETIPQISFSILLYRWYKPLWAIINPIPKWVVYCCFTMFYQHHWGSSSHPFLCEAPGLILQHLPGAPSDCWVGRTFLLVSINWGYPK